MDAVRIKLAALWVSVMLIYLLGDVLRIFAGDFKAGEMGGTEASQWMWILAAVIMLIPIVMIFLSLTLPYPIIRWVNIVAAILLFLFNVVSLGGYAPYDVFLLVVSFGFNALTIWHAWKWVV